MHMHVYSVLCIHTYTSYPHCAGICYLEPGEPRITHAVIELAIRPKQTNSLADRARHVDEKLPCMDCYIQHPVDKVRLHMYVGDQVCMWREGVQFACDTCAVPCIRTWCKLSRRGRRRAQTAARAATSRIIENMSIVSNENLYQFTAGTRRSDSHSFCKPQ